MGSDRKISQEMHPQTPKSIRAFRSTLMSWHTKCARKIPWRRANALYGVLMGHALDMALGTHDAWLAYEDLSIAYPNEHALAGDSAERIASCLEPRYASAVAALLQSTAAAVISDQQDIRVSNEALESSRIARTVASSARRLRLHADSLLLSLHAALLCVRFFGLPPHLARDPEDPALLRFVGSVVGEEGGARLSAALDDFGSSVCGPQPKCRCCPIRPSCCSATNLSPRRLLGLDLFAGAGGLSLGATRAGLDVVYAFEADDRAAATYGLNFPQVAVCRGLLHAGEVATLCAQLGLSAGSVDVIVAGPPCQGFSIANLRTRNEENPGNHLWRIVLEFARILQPRAVLMENVAGLRTYQDGATLGHIADSLRQLGLQSAVFCLDAADFGVPQRRNRVFVAATRSADAFAFVPPVGPDRVTVGMALDDLPLVPNGNAEDRLPYGLPDPASPYQARMRQSGGPFVRNCRASSNAERTLLRFASVPPGGNWEDIPAELFTEYANPKNCHRWLYRRLPEGLPSVTINNFRKNMLIHYRQHRTLTVREAARLQGIHDGFVFAGNLQSQQQQVANAVPPQMAEAVVGQMLTHILKEISSA